MPGKLSQRKTEGEIKNNFTVKYIYERELCVGENSVTPKIIL